MMTKKDFIALADELRPIVGRLDVPYGPNVDGSAVVDALVRFLHAQNPQFKEDRRREYLANGGK